MDHLRLAKLNRRNARNVRDPKLKKSLLGLADFHETEYAKQYHNEAASGNQIDLQHEAMSPEDQNFLQQQKAA